MGEARSRGSFERRKNDAIRCDRNAILEFFGGQDEEVNAALRSGIAPFLSKMKSEEWGVRRGNILKILKNKIESSCDFEHAASIRVQEDEIAWYLFLCEQALENPMCIDVAQAARATPFFAAIGYRWEYAKNIVGIERKILEILNNYKAEPDGVIFEILVALAYAEKGWKVEFIEECSTKRSPDMIVRKGDLELYVECKRLNRRTDYAESERKVFLRLWNNVIPLLKKNEQWIWLKFVFKTDITGKPYEWLSNILEGKLSCLKGNGVVFEDDDLCIYGKVIDRHSVTKHFSQYKVKNNSPTLYKVLGGDFVSENSSVSASYLAKYSQVKDCEIEMLGSYIEDIYWACGCTREFISEKSLNKKAKDIRNKLVEAVKQLPINKKSVIHIAAETSEGKDVEIKRSEKVKKMIENFNFGERQVVRVNFHRFQTNQTLDQLFQVDETIDRYPISGEIYQNDIPVSVVVPSHSDMQQGSHWDIYD